MIEDAAGLFLEERLARLGVHDRVDHEREFVFLRVSPQPLDDGADDFRVCEHARLDVKRPDIGENAVELHRDEVGRYRKDFLDAQAVLRGERGYRRRRVRAEKRDRLDVGLDAGAASAVAAGYGQNFRWRVHYILHRSALEL